VVYFYFSITKIITIIKKSNAYYSKDNLNNWNKKTLKLNKTLFKKLKNKIAGYITHLNKKIYRENFENLSTSLYSQKENGNSIIKFSEFITNIQLVNVDERTYEMFKYITKNLLPFSIKFKFTNF